MVRMSRKSSAREGFLLLGYGIHWNTNYKFWLVGNVPKKIVDFDLTFNPFFGEYKCRLIWYTYTTYLSYQTNATPVFYYLSLFFARIQIYISQRTDKDKGIFWNTRIYLKRTWNGTTSWIATLTWSLRFLKNKPKHFFKSNHLIVKLESAIIPHNHVLVYALIQEVRLYGIPLGKYIFCGSLLPAHPLVPY